MYPVSDVLTGNIDFRIWVELDWIGFQADIILCARCFVRGNYRAGLTSSDFKRLDIEEAAAASASSGGRAASGQIKSEWSEKETLHLLESILHYGGDWKKVAEHVGNGRSQLECIDRFIKLPFGEQFMPTVGGGEQDLGFSKNEKEEDVDDDDSNMEAKRLRLNPLADTSNPIMAQVCANGISHLSFFFMVLELVENNLFSLFSAYFFL